MSNTVKEFDCEDLEAVMRQLQDFTRILFWGEEVCIWRGLLKTIFMAKSSKQSRQQSKSLAAEYQAKSLPLGDKLVE